MFGGSFGGTVALPALHLSPGLLRSIVGDDWPLQRLSEPLAGSYDWPSLIPLVAMIVGGSTLEVWAFVRRDLAAIGSTRAPRMPQALLGIGGPLSRSFGERLPAADGWGAGLAIPALTIAR